MGNFNPDGVVGTKVHARNHPEQRGVITDATGWDPVRVTWDDGSVTTECLYNLKDIEKKRLAGERAAQRWANP